jgi:hypothetical protein
VGLADSARRVRFGIVMAAVLSALAIGAAPASAVQSRFGSDLAPTADGVPAACPGAGSPCELVGRSFHALNLWSATSPISGVVTQFLIRSSAEDTITFKLARETSTPGRFTGAATGPILDLAGDNSVQSVAARIPVTAGDSVSLRDPTSPTFSAVSCAAGATLLYSPPLAPGDDRDSTQNSGCELLVQAVAEPDADADGFGDDTQDGCPASAGPNSGCPTPAAAPGVAPFDRAAAIKACKKKKRKKARKKCIRRAKQRPAA